jgi:hypothetical protein
LLGVLGVLTQCCDALLMMNAGLMEDHGLCKVSDFYKIETINSQEYYIGTLVGRLLFGNFALQHV